MSMGRGSAHGKTIWMGEHAVVYGYPALSLPVRSATLHITVEEAVDDHLSSPFHDGLFSSLPTRLQPVKDLLLGLRTSLGLPPLSVEVRTSIPLSAGMGSSAAFAAALVRACHDHADVTLSDERLAHWIHESEKGMHGNPSGIDGAQVVSERPLLFTKGYDIVLHPISRQGSIMLVSSGIPGHTKDAVIRVASINAKDPGPINELGMLSKRFVEGFSSMDGRAVGEHMDRAHAIMRDLGLSLPIIEKLVGEGKSCGALGAKITGGGMGGMVMLLFEDKEAMDFFQSRMDETGFKTTFVIDLERDFL
jgi:mevalonate kinase